MKTKIKVFFALVIAGTIIVIACNKASTGKGSVKTYTIHANKMNMVGVNNIIVDYDPEAKKANIKFMGVARVALGYKINLDNMSVTAEFADNDILQVISFTGDKQTMFSVKNERVQYAYKSKNIKTVNTASLENSGLELDRSEQVLALIYMSLYNDLLDFTQEKSIDHQNEDPGNAKRTVDYYATIEVGCIQIGGSSSAVTERLKGCKKEGCTMVGSDVSCLWGSHACIGTATFYCPPPPGPEVTWETTPHFFS